MHRLSVAFTAPAVARRTVARCYATTGSKPRVGFIGLGNMGGHMASNLLKVGHPLVVFDVSAASVERLVGEGASSAATPKQLAGQVDYIISMLPSSPHVKDVYTNPNSGIFAAIRPGTLCIDSSTINPGVAREVAKAALLHQANLIDAPVSGGVGGAQAGTLTFMVGSSAALFDQAKPLLEAMGKNIVHCGDVGNGQVAKLCNNLVLGISMVAVSEAMNMGVAMGADPKLLAGIFNTSSARCWSSDTYNPVPGVMPNSPASRGYTGGFGVDLMLKDLRLAVEAAQEANAQLPLGKHAEATYAALSEQGFGKRDFSVIYEYLASLLKK